ncbi:MAG TPA: hypothetical protein VK680_15895 [Solirubrobacteraceae bacterium]|jgi:hypothetical protein|nr:hypothetical protein [Solirubrobacteraceae bacterium]
MTIQMSHSPGGIRAHGVTSRRTRSLTAALITVAALALMPAGAAATEEGVVAFPGSPLSVFVGLRGECQSSYPVTGVNYFIAEKGDCGFFLAFPKDESKKQPTFLREKVFGFSGSAGPGLSNLYVPISQSAVTGEGTGASPYTETTVYDVTEEEEGKVKGTPFAQVTDTTTYIAGAPQFAQTFSVKNEASKTLYFRALYAGDLYVAGNDFGIGSFLGGPPRFIGGDNTAEGILGGFIESTPWSAWQEGCWNETVNEAEEYGRCFGAAPSDKGIWHTVRESATTETGPAFNDEADPAQIDNAAGVEWDEDLTSGLAPKAEASFTVINHTEAPAGLAVSPGSQTLTQGQTATVSVTALNTAGNPYAGATLRYSIGGANPQSGTVTLNSAGQGQLGYVGTNVGVDTIQMYLDLGNSGTQLPTDPSATATVTFLPKPPPPPTPNSTYKIQSIKANSNGTITIVFVPTQNGTATIEVTVPTATIARNEALAAKAKKCKKGQVRIKGKCRPKSTLSGKLSATGVAGVPLTLTVKPSIKVTKSLKKGKTVVLTAKLTYKSALGGTPIVQILHFTVKPHKKH